MNVLILVVAVRFTLFLAVFGAFFLAYTLIPSITKPADPIAIPALVMLVVYGLLVVIPIVWLASRR